MQKLFYLYLSVSLSASVIIAVLFLCRPLWKRRFSKSWQYYIWLLAVVRLLIPLSPAPSPNRPRRRLGLGASGRRRLCCHGSRRSDFYGSGFSSSGFYSSRFTDE